MIYSNAVPAWARLALGTVGQAPFSDGTDLAFVNSWQEISRGTLGAPAATLTLANIPAREFLMIIVAVRGFNVADLCCMRFNADAGANYCQRYSDNFAAGASVINQTYLWIPGVAASVRPQYAIMDVWNNASYEKHCNLHSQYSVAGAANPPVTRDAFGKWTNAVNQISSLTILGNGGNNLLAGTTVVVYGAP